MSEPPWNVKLCVSSVETLTPVGPPGNLNTAIGPDPSPDRQDPILAMNSSPFQIKMFCKQSSRPRGIRSACVPHIRSEATRPGSSVWQPCPQCGAIVRIAAILQTTYSGCHPESACKYAGKGLRPRSRHSRRIAGQTRNDDLFVAGIPVACYTRKQLVMNIEKTLK
jgi:hypothetical protein